MGIHKSIGCMKQEDGEEGDMEDEEYVDTILNIDVILMQVQSDMQTSDNNKALSRIKEARSIIAEMNQTTDGFNRVNLLK